MRVQLGVESVSSFAGIRTLNCTSGAAPYLARHIEPQTKYRCANVPKPARGSFLNPSAPQFGQVPGTSIPMRSASIRSPVSVKQLEQTIESSSAIAMKHNVEVTGAARLYRAASGGMMGWAYTSTVRSGLNDSLPLAPAQRFGNLRECFERNAMLTSTAFRINRKAYVFVSCEKTPVSLASRQ